MRPALVRYDLRTTSPGSVNGGDDSSEPAVASPQPPNRILIPVLDHESDRRVNDTVMKRAAIGDVLLAHMLALHYTGDSDLQFADWVLESLGTR